MQFFIAGHVKDNTKRTVGASNGRLFRHRVAGSRYRETGRHFPKSVVLATAANATPAALSILSNEVHDAAPSSSSEKLESPLMKAAIGAGCTWVYELCIGHSLEFIKVAKQTAPEKSYADLVGGIVHHKGPLGLLDGFFPWGTIQAVAKGAVFSFAAAGARALLEPGVESGAIPEMAAEVVAGGIGGGFQGLVLSPSLLLKTRVMTDPIFRTNMSFAQTCGESGRVGMGVIQKEGMKALMKGSIVFSSKRVADWSSRYFFSSMVELHVFGGGDPVVDVGNTAKLASSLLGGTLSALVTIPIDVMVAQIQQASKAGENVGVVDTFMRQFRAGGISQILAFSTGGFVARVAHVALTTALMKTATSVVYKYWQDQQYAVRE